jgi:hypothetical protein
VEEPWSSPLGLFLLDATSPRLIQTLADAVRVAGPSAEKVEGYLKRKRDHCSKTDCGTQATRGFNGLYSEMPPQVKGGDNYTHRAEQGKEGNSRVCLGIVLISCVRHFAPEDALSPGGFFAAKGQQLVQ